MVVDGNNFKVDEWWQFSPRSIEWLYMMQKMKDSIKPAPTEDICVIGATWTGEALYLLSRKYFPTEAISAATGLTAEALDKHNGVIVLRTKTPEDLPEPTVQGWGTA
jgi:hypothetical protein